ncbi:MAG: succinylglutamate desuccinylase/aspartoacylase family protein [Bacteroidota bacterium]
MRKPHRIIGSFSQGLEGPLLFYIGGIHGNEPAGVLALERVFLQLEELENPFRGKLIGIVGNCTALAMQQRYVDRDLNRLWSEEEIERVKGIPFEERNVEERELGDLIRLLEGAFDTSYEPKIFVDLHTTSAPRGMFSIVTDDTEIREIAEVIGAPIIFNLVDELALTTNKFFDSRGVVGLAFESGQHDDPMAVDVHEAAIWIMLQHTGCLQAADIPNFAQYPELIRQQADGVPTYLSVTHRHPIEPVDQFEMRPGYQNFQPVGQGEVVAKDKAGLIEAPMGGYMLMPLAQKQGEDGYFLVQALDEPPV